MIFAQNPYKSCAKIICNINLTDKILQVKKIGVPLCPVISFSVINYVVSMRAPREWRTHFFCIILKRLPYAAMRTGTEVHLQDG